MAISHQLISGKTAVGQSVGVCLDTMPESGDRQYCLPILLLMAKFVCVSFLTDLFHLNMFVCRMESSVFGVLKLAVC